MTMINIIPPADLVSIPVREHQLIKHGLAKPPLVRGDRGVPTTETPCTCCFAVCRSSMQRLALDEQHASSLIHICHAMGMEGYLKEAKRMSNRLSRLITAGMPVQEALKLLDDPTARSELLAPTKH